MPFLQNTYGWRLQLATGLNLAAATAVTIYLRQPDATGMYSATSPLVTYHCVLPGDIVNAAQGVVSYLVAAGDLAAVGWYQAQAVDVTPGRAIASYPVDFYVAPNVPGAF